MEKTKGTGKIGLVPIIDVPVYGTRITCLLSDYNSIKTVFDVLINIHEGVKNIYEALVNRNHP
ncbi:hypothetical protein CE91St1_23770 [Parabacteroides goldsteinii]|nr:hypothetical protein CE91St1_23770 [Parabacteroides goldsteinii]GKG79169.1 hypothetical protein CE91St2_23610 [Parabacteroides goldsteinii]